RFLSCPPVGAERAGTLELHGVAVIDGLGDRGLACRRLFLPAAPHLTERRVPLPGGVLVRVFHHGCGGLLLCRAFFEFGQPEGSLAVYPYLSGLVGVPEDTG